jgi:hypothetical protein
MILKKNNEGSYDIVRKQACIIYLTTIHLRIF